MRAPVQQGVVLLGHRIDITGHVYGQLTVIEESEKKKAGTYIWKCRCTCGKETHVPVSYLRSGNTKSCGCTHAIAVRKRCTTHGLAPRGKNRHKGYVSWSGIKYRCDVSTGKEYHDYGGRGISYDPKWETFEGFWEDMGATWQEGLSIDRIDVNGNYCKENCRWATPVEQANNKRNSNYVTLNGECKTVADWCRELGLNHKQIRARILRGWSAIDALKEPRGARRNNTIVTYKGATQRLEDLCKDLQLNKRRVAQRLRQGWPIERAIETL